MANRNLGIDNFSAQIDGIQGQGPQTTNRFQLVIPTPKGLLDKGFSTTNELRFWCRSTTMPDIAVALHPVVRYGYGLIENKPSFTKFKDFSVIVMSDSEGMNLRFFHEWLTLINNPYFTEGINTPSDQWEVAYKEDYSVDMNLITYDKSNTPIHNIRYVETFPYIVQPIQLDWGDTNKIMEFSVGFSFMSWSHDASPS